MSDDARIGSGPDGGAPADAAGSLLLSETVDAFRQRKALAERALAQLDPDEWGHRLDPESNSVAIIVRHLAGNMRSRWREFLTSDGEKPERDRDAEFEPDDADLDPEALMAEWDEGWRVALDAIGALRPEDMTRTITIRGRPQTVAAALLRQLTHYAEHVGQIVLLAKHLRGERWETLSIPRTRR